MKSATSYFDRGEFVKSVLRFWPIWAIYAFVWLLVLTMNTAGMLGARSFDFVNREVLQAATYSAVFICPIACCAAALAVFSHLYSERAAGFYAALPVSRGAMFVSVSLAGLLPLLVVNVLAFLATLAVEAVFGFSGLAALLEWLGVVSLLTVTYFGIAALCAQLTGHLVVMPVLFITFGVVVSWLGNMALVVPGMFCYGYVSDGAGIADLLSPFVCFAQELYVTHTAQGGYELVGWTCLIVYGIVGLALLPVSLALYRRRNMESAGDVVAIEPLKPVVQLVCAFASAFILGNALFTLPFGSSPADGVLPAIVYALCMAVAAFIGWFGSAMIVNKTFAVFGNKTGYALWAGVSLLCAALVLTCELDVTGYETRVPEESDVVSVMVGDGGVNVTFSEPENIASAIAVHESVIDSRDENEAARAAGRSAVWLYLNYTLANGDELKREYMLPQDGESRALDAAQALELYSECILPDMRERTIGLVWYRTDETYYESVCNCRISICAETQDGVWAEFFTVPTIWSERTNAWLAAHGIELETLAAAVDGQQ